MADVDNGDPLGPQFVDDGEQGLYLSGGEGGGGFVQNQYLTVGGHRLSNLHQLHLGYAEGAQFGPGIVVEVDFLQHPGGVLIHFVVVNGDDGAETLNRVAAHIDVFSDAAFGDGLKFLVNHGNAPVQRVQRSVNGHLFPLVDHFALVHMIDAKHTLHQRGLASAVFPHQGVDGAGAELELGVIQSLDAGKGFDHIPHFQTIF